MQAENGMTRSVRTHDTRDCELSDSTTTWAYALRRHLLWSSLRGDASVTVELRRIHLIRFADWCVAHALHKPSEVTFRHVEGFHALVRSTKRRDGRSLAVSTQLQRLYPLRVFFRWALRESIVGADPTLRMELPRLPVRVPEAVMSIEEVRRVLACVNGASAIEVRDRAIMETLYSCGLRRSEVAGLQLADVDSHKGVIYVRRAKGGRNRHVPVGRIALHWIERYVREARPGLVADSDDTTLFLHARGEPLRKHRLSDLVKRRLCAAEIRRTGSCHLFRHAMATHMLDNGADIRHLQLILGHAQLNTTAIYTHVSIGRLSAVHARTHPAELAFREECGILP